MKKVILSLAVAFIASMSLTAVAQCPKAGKCEKIEQCEAKKECKKECKKACKNESGKKCAKKCDKKCEAKKDCAKKCNKKKACK